MFDIDDNLKKLPDKPGVYLHRDKYGEIIYVGKAISLKKRVRQYFSGKRDAKTLALASNIVEFETIVTKNEAEALILENTLIKRHFPKYNVLLRDDKTYPYLKITTGEQWPRLLKTRELKSDGSKYFGPYVEVKAVNRIVGLFNDIFRLKRCPTVVFPEGHRPCLHGHIDQCREICSGNADHEEYLRDIDRLIQFLKGNDSSLMRFLKENMEKSAEATDYEAAAKWRDYASAANSITEKQRVELLSSGSMDIVLAAFPEQGTSEDEVTLKQEDSEEPVESQKSAKIPAQVAVFFVRDGRLVGRELHHLDAAAGTQKKELVAAFISQYYIDQTTRPGEILLEEHIPEESFIESALAGDGEGRKSRIIVPERGKKKDLVKLALNDMSEIAKQILVRAQREKEKKEKLMQELSVVFGDLISGSDIRIEAYDISNTGGVDSVGAMVVFNKTSPEKKSYRRFRIRSDVKGDDYAAMQEVLYRRFKRAKEGDKGFAVLPDLLFIDGGIGHVNSAMLVTKALEIDIPVAGMVKDEGHRTRGLIYRDNEFDLKELPELYHLCGAIQEEVHRFAVEYHRGLRGKEAVRSELDNIPGIGKKRRNSLLMAFGSVDAIKEASKEKLEETPGMNAGAADAVWQYFNNNSAQKQE